MILRKCINVIFCLVFWLFSCTLSGQPNAPFSVLQGVYSLEEITKQRHIVLNGHLPIYHLYLPIKSQWNIEGLKLNLLVHRSPVLLPYSTLTVLVRDTPIDTIKLDFPSGEVNSWEVMIPKTYIPENEKTLKVSLSGYMLVSDKICQDLENKGNWVNIAGSSLVTYVYDRHTSYDLKEFPHPFVQVNAPAIDKVTFVLPNKIQKTHLYPYLQMAHYLSHKASWRGINFSLLGMHQYLESHSIKDNIVVMGTPSDFDLEQLNIPLPIDTNSQGQLVMRNSVLNDESGLVLLTRNPKSPDYALLLILANTSKGITSVVQALTHGMIQAEANNPGYYLLLSENYFPTNSKVHRSPIVEFSELGYRDRTVYGEGEQQISMQFKVQPQWVSHSAELSLIYSHSPFLDKGSTSYLYIILNGQPINGVELEPNSGVKKKVSLKLPQKQLKIGTNQLEIVFDLNLKSEHCTRFRLNSAWGTIYNTSYFEFIPSDKNISRTLDAYPYFFQSPVLIRLPEEVEIYRNMRLVKQLFNFVASLSYTTDLYFEFNSNPLRKVEELNLIDISTFNSPSLGLVLLSKVFGPLFEQLEHSKNSTLKAINSKLFSESFNQRKDLGYVGITASNTHKTNTQLIIYGYGPKEVMLAFSLLNDAYKRSQLIGNIAIVFNNGTYTSLDTRDIDKQVKAEEQIEVVRVIFSYVLALMLIVAVIVIVGIVLMVKSIKNK